MNMVCSVEQALAQDWDMPPNFSPSRACTFVLWTPSLSLSEAITFSIFD
jgi:hypothetical protein